MALKKCRQCKKEISPNAKSCPHCGEPNKTKSNSGCGCITLFFLFCIFVSLTSNNNQTSQTQTTPTKKANKPVVSKTSPKMETEEEKKKREEQEKIVNEKKKKEKAERERLALEKKAQQEKLKEVLLKKAELNLEQYIKILNSDNTAKLLVAEVGYDPQGILPQEYIIVKVKNNWHFLPKQVRLQHAQNLWAIWAKICSPSEPDNARLKLVDLNSNEIGGSRGWAGSLLWVND